MKNSQQDAVTHAAEAAAGSHVVTHTQPATLAIRWSTLTAAAMGISVGMVIGAVGFQQAIKQYPIQLEMLTADTHAQICINGVAFEMRDAGINSPWHGVYQAVSQGQPSSFDKDGREVLRQSLPGHCKASHG